MGSGGTTTFLERSRFIPLRLSADERRLLHLLEAALSVSSYTDKASGSNGSVTGMYLDMRRNTATICAGVWVALTRACWMLKGDGTCAQVDILSWRNKSARVHAQVRKRLLLSGCPRVSGPTDHGSPLVYQYCPVPRVLLLPSRR